MQAAEDEAQIDVASEVAILKDLLVKRDRAEAKMLGLVLRSLHELGYVRSPEEGGE